MENNTIQVGDFVTVRCLDGMIGTVRSHVNLGGPAKYVVNVLGFPTEQVFPLTELSKA